MQVEYLSIQVVEHAAAVNKLNAAEVASNAADQRLRQIRDEIHAAQQAKVCAISLCFEHYACILDLSHSPLMLRLATILKSSIICGATYSHVL